MQERNERMSLLTVKELTGGYTRNPVLRDVSFAIEREQIVGLIGFERSGEKHDDPAYHRLNGTAQRISVELNGKTFMHLIRNIVPNLRLFRKRRFYMKS